MLNVVSAEVLLTASHHTKDCALPPFQGEVTLYDMTLQGGSKDAMPETSRAYKPAQWRLAPPAISMQVG